MINQTALKYIMDCKPEERIYMCGKDFSLFMVYYFLNYLKFPFAPFHYEWFEDLQDLSEAKINELALIAFRESAKTSFAKIFLIWLICYRKKKYINVDSFDKENSERVLFDIVLTFQDNHRLIGDFGQLFNTARNKDQATVKRVNNFVTNNGVRVEAHSTQESIRGRVHGDQRPDFILFDDIETTKTKESKAYTKQVADHLEEALTGIASDSYSVLYLGNYISDFGNIASMEKRAKSNPLFRFRKVAILDSEGKVTWPGKYCLTDAEAVGTNKVSIETLRTRFTPMTFSAELMNQPIDEATQEFKRSYFIPSTNEEVNKSRTNCFILIDTALSEKDENDDTGVAVIWVDRDNNWFVRAFPKRINSAGLINLLFDLHTLYKPNLIGIEETMFTMAIKPFLNEEMRKRNEFLPIRELKHGGRKKEVRIRGLIPRYEAKAIKHIDSPVLEEQLLQFPQGLHDDVADAVAYGLDLCYAPFNDRDTSHLFEDNPTYPDIGL